MSPEASKPVVFITGGSRGIGASMIQKFKASGWRVAACSRDGESVRASGADLPLACDVTELGQVKAALAETVRKLGQLDAVVNNAGLAGTNPMDPCSAGDNDELWHRILDVNLNGTYYVSKYALPHLPEGRGRIINIASVLAHKGVPDQTAYCAAKHAVLGFTRALAHYAAPRRITVNVISPGWTRTEMAEGRMKELGLTEVSLEQGVPIGRFIEPSEVAELAVYLASEKASGITGQSFVIDGGAIA